MKKQTYRICETRIRKNKFKKQKRKKLPNMQLLLFLMLVLFFFQFGLTLFCLFVYLLCVVVFKLIIQMFFVFISHYTLFLFSYYTPNICKTKTHKYIHTFTHKSVNKTSLTEKLFKVKKELSLAAISLKNIVVFIVFV